MPTLSILVAAILAGHTASVVQAADLTARCESQKLKAIGSYVACRMKLGAKAASREEAPHSGRLSRCTERFIAQWKRANDVAAGEGCGGGAQTVPTAAEATSRLFTEWATDFVLGEDVSLCSTPAPSSTTTTTVAPTTTTTVSSTTTTLPEFTCANLSGSWDWDGGGGSVLHETESGQVVLTLAGADSTVLAVLEGTRLGFTITWDRVYGLLSGFGVSPATIYETATCNQFYFELDDWNLYFEMERSGASYCGDGALQVGEICDDGNADNSDGCLLYGCDPHHSCYSCVPSVCGDGIVSTGEECDDGNDVIGDGCDIDCTIERCGNALLEPGEECDDGNRVDGDSCDRNCVIEVCGNQVPQTGEQCDGSTNGQTCETLGYDGGRLGCSMDCLFDESDCASCGDGLAGYGEDCDGADSGNCAGSCRTDCICSGCPVCGDGVCEGDENKCNCPDFACAGVGPTICTGTAVCGDGLCDSTAENGESHETCAVDCPKVGCIE